MKYEKCLLCKELPGACDGPNFLAMETSELGLWCNEKRKHIPGMTYDKIASETGISKSAVYSFLTGAHSDYRIETIRPIVKLITGGKWDDNPCGNLSNSEKAQYEEKMRFYDSEMKWRDDKIQHILSENKSLQGRIVDSNRILQDRYEFLKRKDRVIGLLSILLAITLLVIIAALVIDSINPNIGFFWVDR